MEMGWEGQCKTEETLDWPQRKEKSYIYRMVIVPPSRKETDGFHVGQNLPE